MAKSLKDVRSVTRQQLIAGMRDYRKGRYEQIAAHVKLKAAAGVLTPEDIAAIEQSDPPAEAARFDHELG